MNLKTMLHWRVAAAGLLLVGLTSPAVPAEQSVVEDVERCREDPRYRIGGAMIGDCLTELSQAVDREIEAAMATGEQRYCLAEDRADYRQIHVDWQAYRTRICALVDRSPDNTSSWVSSAGCRLELGRQRLAALRYTNDYGTPRCPIEP